MSRRSETTTKVFVGSLPGGVTTDDLRKLFEPYGPIAECDIANRCGFLHLENKELALKAIEELNNTNFMGTRISVEKGRVKPPRSRRDSGGPMRGGKDRAGPYARDGFRGPPRNGSAGGYGARDFSYGGGDRYDYDRGMPPRDAYDAAYAVRGAGMSPYDDRRGMAGAYGQDRRPYPNGYDRRPMYDDRGAYADPARAGYDDRHMPPGPVGYDDRRAMPMDRRPLIDDQTAGGMRGAAPPAYDRAAVATDMYSRRDAGPKAIGGYGDRDMSGYATGAGAAAAAYAPMAGAGTVGAGYTSSMAPGSYGAPPSYGANSVAAAGGYGDGRATSASYAAAPVAANYNTAATYDDPYANRSGGYDSAYPALPQQRGFSSGSGSGGPRRDIPSTRRY